MQTSEETSQNDVFVNAYYGFVRPSHSGIRLVRETARQNSGVSCWDVSVRSDHCGGTPVEVPAHGNFFTGQFRVEVHEANFDVRIEFRQQFVRFTKRTVNVGHVSSPLQVEHRVTDAVSRFSRIDTASR